MNAHLHERILIDEAGEDERDEYIVTMQIWQAQELEEAERMGRRPGMYWIGVNLQVSGRIFSVFRSRPSRLRPH